MSAAPSSFPLFTSLPPEIQTLIWDAAVRPVPGDRHFHRFIFQGAGRCSPPYEVQQPIPGWVLDLGPSEYTLCVPWRDSTYGRNDSVYALDSGLWMACQNSRRAMKYHFLQNRWWEFSSKLGLPGCRNPEKEFRLDEDYISDQVTHTASYIDQDDKVHHVTFNYALDVAHLNPMGIDTVDWFYHYAGDEAPLLSHVHLHGATTPGFLPLNLAIDYDPAMLDVTEGNLQHRCFGRPDMSSSGLADMLRLFANECERVVWMIDYRLQRQQSLEPPGLRQGEPRTVFYSADYIFVEVQRQDLNYWAIDTRNQPTDDARSVHDFYDALANSGALAMEEEDVQFFKVLACLTRQGKTPEWPLKQRVSSTCEACQPPGPPPEWKDIKLDDIDGVVDMGGFDDIMEEGG